MHTDSDTKHSHYHNKDIVMAGIAGILAGAASITALALTDPAIRNKVGKRAKNTISNLQDWSADKLHMVEHHAIKTVEKTEKATEDSKEDEPLKHAMHN